MTALVQAEDEKRPLADDSPDAVNVTLAFEGEEVLRITLRPGGQITAEDGAMVRERYQTLTGGAGCTVLLEVTGVEQVSREAVRVFSEAATVTAFAILGTTSVDRVIAHGRRGLPLPPCPSRYFTDEQEALAWLRQKP